MALVTRQRHHQHQDLWDMFWKDRHGNVVVYQHPNALLIVWAVLTLASLFTYGTVSNVFWWISLLALAGWSLREIFVGVNYFRRGLGGVVLLMTIMAAFKLGL